MKNDFNQKMTTAIFIALFSGVVVANAQYQYPETKTVQASDTYFGTTVEDPYRWLEDLKSPEVQQWFKTQSDYTNAQLAKIPGRDKLTEEFKKYDAVRAVQYAPLGMAGSKYFYQKRFPGEQSSKLFCRQGKAGKEVMLFDPEKYISGKVFSYNPSISDDGSKIVLSLS